MYVLLIKGWDRLHGSDQGCPRKSESVDFLHQPSSNDYRGYDVVDDDAGEGHGVGGLHGVGGHHTVGPNCINLPKIREINCSYICLQQFDIFFEYEENEMTGNGNYMY